MEDADLDLHAYTKEQLVNEIVKLRAGIREHRDSSQHDLCWHHPKLWSLLPEKVDPQIMVPEWPQFLKGCIQYRQSLDEQRPMAPRTEDEFEANTDVNILINIDVPDLESASLFYQKAFQMRLGRKLGNGGLELLGASSPIYLLKKDAGSIPFPGATTARKYERHWAPVHLDFVVENIVETRITVLEAGAIEESPVEVRSWGKMAMFQDPFGHGFCLIEFVGRGYDEIGTGKI